GAKKAHASGFAYSETLAGMDGSWDYLALNKFLWKPKYYVEGTKMNFIGLKKPEDRAALIAWLRTKGSSAGAPSEAQIAAEAAELTPPEPEAPAEGEAKLGEAKKAEAPTAAAH
ncbi:MAG TPA: cytochrome c family protein, partial [Alphaproteobacteria bacterium]|nr:cytochrome c family protein [Alphaproteobacteria bacterium]